MKNLTDFAKGLIAGIVASVIIFSTVSGIYFFNKRNKELIKNAEKQIEIEALREDYSNIDPLELLDDIPRVRRAADGASAEFNRELDEILQRFRNRFADR